MNIELNVSLLPPWSYLSLHLDKMWRNQKGFGYQQTYSGHSLILDFDPHQTKEKLTWLNRGMTLLLLMCFHWKAACRTSALSMSGNNTDLCVQTNVRDCLTRCLSVWLTHLCMASTPTIINCGQVKCWFKSSARIVFFCCLLTITL